MRPPTNTAVGVGAGYASAQAAALAKRFGVNEDYIRIGADAIQLIGLIKAARAARGNTTKPLPKATDLKLSGTNLRHSYEVNAASGRPSRPYLNSRAIIQEIMDATPPVPDKIRAGFLKWDAEGSMNGSSGVYELVIDPATNTIVHFLFRSN